MTRFDNLSGLRFGRVTAVEFYGLNANRNALWTCRCDCGCEFVALAVNLKSGRTRSCGCLRSEETGRRNRARFARI